LSFSITNSSDVPLRVTAPPTSSTTAASSLLTRTERRRAVPGIAIRTSPSSHR
jgi:hypothetical protein